MPLNDLVRETIVDAPRDVVWKFVSVPGWWISDQHGRQDGMTWEPTDEGQLVSHPEYGEFHLRTLEERPMDSVTFALATGSPDDARRAADCGNTTVTFDVKEADDESTQVRVTERGFAEIDYTAHPNAVTIERNAAGWELQLANLKARAEGDI